MKDKKQLLTYMINTHKLLEKVVDSTDDVDLLYDIFKFAVYSDELMKELIKEVYGNDN